MSGAIDRLAEEDPLSHPLAFVKRHRDHKYESPAHLREVYQAVFQGMSPRYPNAPRRLCRLYPREHGKSEAGTVDTPAWAAMRDPNVRVLIMSETTPQAKNKLRQCRDIIERVAPQYGREVIEDTKKSLTLERQANHDVPTIQAAGFDTGVTGGHYDVLVFDDIVSYKTQRTETRRTNAWLQFSDYSQNLGSEGESVYLVLGTRKHPEDLYGRLLDSIGWESRVKPAIFDWSVVENGEYDIVTTDGESYAPDEIHRINPRTQTVGRVEPHRSVDVLWPERWPLSKLLENYISSMTGGDSGEVDAIEGSLVWKRENQNDASALQGQVLGESMLHFVDELPDGRYYTYAGVDLGIEEDPEKAARNDTDYWAVVVGRHNYDADVTYLTDVHRRRGMTLEKGIHWVREKVRPVDASRVNVESNQAQRWFVQTARDKGLDFQQTSSSGSKEERIIAMSSRFESGRVQILDPGRGRKDKWQSYVNEWAAFPTGSHDDRLDATEIMLRALTQENISYSEHDLQDLPTGWGIGRDDARRGTHSWW